MATITSPQSLGTALRATRKRLGLTQADLALAAGVGLRFIVELEGGKPTVRLEQVLRVVDALGGSLSLTGLDPDPALAYESHHGA
ncbi:MAG: helix-turn-helix transcriptional regulator [Betaproteobacteria bacterium]|nr:helix-turn-helix transcriptional regulator [Betaproteobacteria bacterium]